MLLLAVVLVAIAGAVVYLEPADKEELEKDPDATAVIWTVEPDEVVQVRIERHADPQVDTVELVREGKDWKMTSPVPWDADADGAAQLLDGLRDVKRGVPIDDPGDPEVFGLGDPPVAVVTLTLKSGETQRLEVGKEAPVGYRTYLRAADGRIAAANGNLGKDLLRKAQDFRDSRMFHFDPGEVSRVTLSSAQGTLSVYRDDARRWWSEGWTRADPDRVDDLLLGLLDLRFDTFLDKAVDGPIENPERVVRVETIDGVVHQLRVGATTPMGALVQTDAATGSAFPQALALLGQGPTDVGDRDAFPFDPERSSRLEVRLGDRAGTWVLEGMGWKIDDAIDITVPPAVDQARIRYTRAPVPAPTEDWGEVKVVHDGTDRTVRIGQQIDEDRVAIDVDGGEPYLIPVADLQAIRQGMRGKP